MMEVNKKYMYRCLELARYGEGFVAPNPMVGAVIVHDHKIIGEGFHRKWGEAHAEVHAINAVKDQSLLKESVLYVNLEPCSHYGKTPPCAELIIRKGIPKVVIAQEDPFPQVAGKGIQVLQEHGIEVVKDILKEEAEELNIRFMTTVRKNRPYVLLKWAQSADGYMDTFRKVGDGKCPVKFSNDFTQIQVHKLRAEMSAIMVGTRTLLLDQPRLNVRLWDGLDPIVVRPDSSKDLSVLLKELYEQGIQSLIVEGGRELLQSFIRSGIWEEARIEVATLQLHAGVQAPILQGTLETVQKCKKSTVLKYKN